MDNYTPDGSGTVIINILDYEGNLVKTIYKNLSEVKVPKKEDSEQSE